MLRIVTYHYVRDVEGSPYPGLKAFAVDRFRTQLDDLGRQFSIVSLNQALDMLRRPGNGDRDACLLTFDDGVKEHYSTVAPMLAERDWQGVFFLISRCLDDGWMAPVHMNHLLMATLPFAEYQSRFTEAAYERCELPVIDPQIAASTYRWDEPEVACFKYLFNFALPAEIRDAVVRRIFQQSFGDEREMARQFYVTWDEARQMQDMGMTLGGHTHEHRPLSSLNSEELASDLGACARLCFQNLQPQAEWPFSYPYGKSASFTEAAIQHLRTLGFGCAVTTEPGDNHSGSDLYRLRRRDCVEAVARPKGEGNA